MKEIKKTRQKKKEDEEREKYITKDAICYGTLNTNNFLFYFILFS